MSHAPLSSGNILMNCLGWLLMCRACVRHAPEPKLVCTCRCLYSQLPWTQTHSRAFVMPCRRFLQAVERSALLLHLVTVTMSAIEECLLGAPIAVKFEKLNFEIAVLFDPRLPHAFLFRIFERFCSPCR